MGEALHRLYTGSLLLLCYRGVDVRRSQQALGAAARRAHRRGHRRVETGDAAGEARCVARGDESRDH
eukprot:3303232-Prymnesium_polylepis.3